MLKTARKHQIVLLTLGRRIDIARPVLENVDISNLIFLLFSSCPFSEAFTHETALVLWLLLWNVKLAFEGMCLTSSLFHVKLWIICHNSQGIPHTFSKLASIIFIINWILSSLLLKTLIIVSISSTTKVGVGGEELIKSKSMSIVSIVEIFFSKTRRTVQYNAKKRVRYK